MHPTNKELLLSSLALLGVFTQCMHAEQASDTVVPKMQDMQARRLVSKAEVATAMHNTYISTDTLAHILHVTCNVTQLPRHLVVAQAWG